MQGCQFSDFKSDFRCFENKGNWHKIAQIVKNMDKISLVSKDSLVSGKGIDNPSLNTVSTHEASSDYLQTKFRLSE